MKIDWKIFFLLPLVVAVSKRFMNESLLDINHSLTQIESETSSAISQGQMENQIIDKSKIAKSYLKNSHQRTPAQSDEAVWKDYENVKISSRYDIAPSLAAIEKYHYRPELGAKVSEKDGWIVFRAQQLTENIHPVVIDRTTNRTHPISHILHVKNASLDLKQELNDVGLKTYYYNERLKLLSLESEPHKVFETYEKLTKSGLEVQLEVLKDLPQLN